MLTGRRLPMSKNEFDLRSGVSVVTLVVAVSR
jgi:hypothetical protein